MTTAAAPDGLRFAIEVAVWTVLIACLLAVLAAAGLSMLGPGIERLCRKLVRVPTAQDLLLDPHWRASPQAGTASGPPPCLIPRRAPD